MLIDFIFVVFNMEFTLFEFIAIFDIFRFMLNLSLLKFWIDFYNVFDLNWFLKKYFITILKILNYF